MKKIIPVPYIDQTKKWPTGCESVSAVMLLDYLGSKTTVDEFIEKYLEKKDFVTWNEKTIGPNPREFFAGSPYDRESFGCYAPVIVHALNQAFLQEELPYLATDVSGTSLDSLQKTYIDKDMPVVFWSCIDLKPMIVGPSWYLENGEEFIWRSNEHCMLWVGYDEEKYYFNDPWENHGTIGYDKELVMVRHKEQYEMAVAVIER